MPVFPSLSRLALALAVAAATLWVPAQSAADLAKIRRSIETCNILPKDYREHINIMQSRDIVLLSVYRDPDAKPNDCKIDAVLLTHKILATGAAPGQVRVIFYHLLEPDKYWQVDVKPRSVSAYARGAIGKTEVINNARLSVHQVNSLAKTYGRVPYKEIVDGLGVIGGPFREDRAVALIRIDNLQTKGQQVSDLKRQYLHLEDQVRRGEQPPLKIKRNLAELLAAIDKAATASMRDSMLDALVKNEDGSSH